MGVLSAWVFCNGVLSAKLVYLQGLSIFSGALSVLGIILYECSIYIVVTISMVYEHPYIISIHKGIYEHPCLVSDIFFFVELQ